MHHRFAIRLFRLPIQARMYSAPTVSNITVGDVLAQREKIFSNLDEASHGELHPHFDQWQSIRHDATVHSAVNLMVQRNIGSLIVTHQGQGVVGIVTERDILNKVAVDDDHENVSVKDIMSKHILCIEPSTTIMEALATMDKEKIRHLAVIHTEFKQAVSKDHVPIDAMRSVLSIKDILKVYAEDKKQELTDLKNIIIEDEPKNNADNEESKKDSPPAAVTASTLLRQKHEKINLILNTRVDDNVSVAEAVTEMAKRKFGAVLVMDDGKKIQGIFTERDYLTRVLHPKLNSREVLTTEVCTKSVWSLPSDATLHTCVLEAATRNYHHFPVVDTKDEIVGLLSVKDIVKEICSEIKPTRGFSLMEYFKPKPVEKVETPKPAEKEETPKAVDEVKQEKVVEESSEKATETPKAA